MAAGLGSRYGGLKQLEKLAPGNELIMNYSIYDAIQVGFQHIVFVIREDMQDMIEDVIGKRIRRYVKITYVVQTTQTIKTTYNIPKERTKPLGTAHAILCCRPVIKGSFVVINADDYYGKEALVRMYEWLLQKNELESYQYCMAGYILENTLSMHGGVTRGLCKVDEQNRLIEIKETKQIRRDGMLVHACDENGNDKKIDPTSVVSMNMWGFTSDIMKLLERYFEHFLAYDFRMEQNAEFLLPVVIGQMIKEKKVSVQVLQTNDHWFGVTYREDKEIVEQSLCELIHLGKYPRQLFS